MEGALVRFLKLLVMSVITDIVHLLLQVNGTGPSVGLFPTMIC